MRTAHRTRFSIGYLQELTHDNFELRSEDNSVGMVTSAMGWTRDGETSLVSRGFRQALRPTQSLI